MGRGSTDDLVIGEEVPEALDDLPVQLRREVEDVPGVCIEDEDNLDLYSSAQAIIHFMLRSKPAQSGWPSLKGSKVATQRRAQVWWSTSASSPTHAQGVSFQVVSGKSFMGSGYFFGAI